MQSNAAYVTTTTQGMVEADKWPALLRRLDDLLCDIASGDQGALTPPKRTISAALHAIDVLREGYPIEAQWRDEGLEA